MARQSGRDWLVELLTVEERMRTTVTDLTDAFGKMQRSMFEYAERLARIEAGFELIFLRVNENTRQINENTRQSNENTRQINENTRQINENTTSIGGAYEMAREATAAAQVSSQHLSQALVVTRSKLLELDANVRRATKIAIELLNNDEESLARQKRADAENERLNARLLELEKRLGIID